MAISDYLNSLINDKKNLAANLNTKGVAASSDEKFTTLVPKVLDINTSGLDTSDATATPADIKDGLTAYANGEKITGTAHTSDAITAVVDGKEHLLQEGFYNGGITIPADENLVASNIKKGVTIYGTTGSLEVSTEGLDTSDATATADDIKENKTAYVNGEKVTGTIPCTETETIITPSTENNILQPGFYNGITVNGDLNLLAENIKKDVTIFGVTGTYKPEGGVKRNILINCKTMSSSTEAYNAYTDKIKVTDDGTTFHNITDYTYNKISTIYQVSMAGVNFKTETTVDIGFYFVDPITITSDLGILLNFIYLVSTWINPTVNIRFIEANSAEEAETKIVNKEFAFTKSIILSNPNNKNLVSFPIENSPKGNFYLYFECPVGSYGNECIINYMSLLDL